MSQDYPGLFLVFEGPDCSGKTTMVDHVRAAIDTHGISTVKTREPGGTPVAEALRNIVLHQHMPPMTELLIFAAARSDHVETKIRPALQEGHLVLCDRYSMTTYAYQGHGRGLKPFLHTVEQLSHNNFKPDITLFFDVDFEIAGQRALKRLKETGKGDRLDEGGEAFRRKLFDGYQEAFRSGFHPNTYRIDANQDVAGVMAQCDELVTNKILPAYWEKQRGKPERILVERAGGL